MRVWDFVVVCSALAAACSKSDGQKRRKDVARPTEDMVAVAAGNFIGTKLQCPDGAILRQRTRDDDINYTDILQHSDAFTIDRETVRCGAYQRCVNAGVCERFSCLTDAAEPDFKNAKRYCEWRGARLAHFSEWQRAMRGTDGRLYPSGKRDLSACEFGVRPCLQTSPEGLSLDVKAREWTGDLECTGSGDTLDRRPVMFNLGGGYLSGVMTPIYTTAEFRCVR